MVDLKKALELLGPLRHRFLRMNIANKMLLGYIPIFLLMIAVASYSLKNIRELRDISESIIQVDMPMLETSELMMENIFAMESFAKRYSILKTPEMRRAFWQRSSEFEAALEKVRALRGGNLSAELEAINQSHAKYVDLLASNLEKIGRKDKGAEKLEASIKAGQEEIIEQIKRASLDARAEQVRKVKIASDISSETYTTTLAICIFGLVASLAAALLIKQSIAGAAETLKKATVLVSEGKFDNMPTITNQDELGDLSIAFSDMARRLKSLEEMYLDASPLTHLPGGIAIDNVLRKRIESGQDLAFCVIDLDNFKAYNDRYGFARGNEVIRETARILERAVEAGGRENDFVGHVGGDDFVIITKISKFPSICKGIIAEFDSRMPELYDPEDREQGFILGKNRQGVEMEFPLVSITIAVVTSSTHEFKDHLQVSEVAADLKEYAKGIKGSVYVVDRRRLQDKPRDSEAIKEEAS